jgi:UDP-N-acetylglucosamine:LPS N-acetylglucosamine transferase
MRVLIAGGGTGGHIYPGIVVAQHLQAKGAKVLFVGTKKGMEADIIPRYGFDFTTISSRYIPRRISPAVFVALASAGRGFLEAAAIVRDFHPDVVVGMGGYVAGSSVGSFNKVLIGGRFTMLMGTCSFCVTDVSVWVTDAFVFSSLSALASRGPR